VGSPERRVKPVAVRADVTGVAEDSGVHPVMTALSRGMSLTLLLDLAEPAGPPSAQIHATESADLTWMRDLAFPAPDAGTARDEAAATG
jgi:hypothetical protein